MTTRWWWLPAVAAVVVGVGLSILLVELAVFAGLGNGGLVKGLVLLPAALGVAGAGGVLHRRRAVRFPSTVGTNRFASAMRGYDPREVDAFWETVDSRSTSELDEATFSLASPGYEPEAVEKALALRVAAREREAR